MDKFEWFEIAGTEASVRVCTPIRKRDLSKNEREMVCREFSVVSIDGRARIMLADVACKIRPYNKQVELPRNTGDLKGVNVSFSVRKGETRKKDSVTLLLHDGHLCGYTGMSDQYFYYTFFRRIGMPLNVALIILDDKEWMQLRQIDLGVNGKNSMQLEQNLVFSRRLNGQSTIKDLPVDINADVLERAKNILMGKECLPKFERQRN